LALVNFTENLRRHVECPPAEVKASTVREALEAVFADNPQLKSYILDDQSRLRRHVNVFVNGRLARDRLALSDKLGASDEVFVFQALSGG
jgi:molybdopterin converting factor small subunit